MQAYPLRRHEDPAAWIKHQKRRWQSGVQESKKRKLEAAKAAGRPPDPSKAPKGTQPSADWCTLCHQSHESCLAYINAAAMQSFQPETTSAHGLAWSSVECQKQLLAWLHLCCDGTQVSVHHAHS